MLYSSGDTGIRRLAPPYDSTQIWTLVVNRYSIRPLLTLGLDTLLVNDYSRMARSTDGGATFTVTSGLRTEGTPVEIPLGRPFGGSVVVPGRAGAAGDRYGAYSRDRGATWQEAAILGGDWGSIYPASEALAVVPGGPRAGRVVSVGVWGLATSDDGGATYRSVPGWWGYARMQATAIGVLRGAAPGGGDRLVAVHDDIQDPTPGTAVVVSDDGGDTWRRAFYLTGDPNEYGAAVVDFGGGQGVIAMDGGQVWATADGGESWHVEGIVPGSLVDPATPNAIGRVWWALRGPEGRLYIGGGRLGQGNPNPGWMFRTASPFVVASSSGPEASPGVSLSVRPNPAGGVVSVIVMAPEPGDAVVVVLDALGRAVARVHAGPVAAGATPFALDTSGWAAGVYVVRATVGGQTTTARLVVTR